MGLAFLITTDNLQLLSERKVLKESEYAALLSASAVVESARMEARRILNKAEHQADEQRRRGYEEGREQAKTEYATQLVSESMSAERQLQALRVSMAQLVVKAVTQLLSEVDSAELFRAALLRVEGLLRAEPFITVRVAPAQDKAMREVIEQLRVEADWDMPISVTADASLPAGTCLVQTSTGMLEIGVDAQLEAFRRALERGGLTPPAARVR